jgi:hypothetical protein
MQTPPSHENLRTHSPRSSPRRNTPASRPQGTSAILIEDTTDMEVAIELIEMRYQEYCARMEMEALFAEGELNCL